VKQVPWTIGGEPEEVDAGSFDGEVWVWLLRRDGHQRQIPVRISGTALNSRPVWDETEKAIESHGREAVLRVLNWPSPPDYIEFNTSQGPIYGPRVAHIRRAADAHSCQRCQMRDSDDLENFNWGVLDLGEIRATEHRFFDNLEQVPSHYRVCGR
jgi:hypothetical protein